MNYNGEKIFQIDHLGLELWPDIKDDLIFYTRMVGCRIAIEHRSTDFYKSLKMSEKVHNC